MAKVTKRVYVCETCGALADEPGHLCSPKGQPMKCNYCGFEHAAHVKHFCEGKMKDLKYTCEQCGRLATSADVLCQPTKVPEA